MRNFLTNTAVAVASIALTTGIVAFADPANADIGTETVRVVVPVADLDLHSDAGRTTAERRIHNAAEQICGEDMRDLKSAACRSQAIDAARQSLDRIAAL